MNLDKLILKNFLTYEYLEHDFERRPLLVQGLNLTDDKQKTNGTGKSGMQTGIEFCITASNSRDVKDAELVTYDKKEANAQLFASCDMRKQHLHIDWTIKVKGSNVLALRTKQYGSDEWTNVSFSNVNDGKKYIIEWFAISKEDLFNYYIINKTRFKSFFKSSNKEKVDLINRFSDASIIEGLEKIDTLELEVDFKSIEMKIANTEGKIELIQDRIQTESERDLESELDEDKSDYLLEIEANEDSISVVEKTISSKTLLIKKIKDEDIKEIEQDKKTAAKDKVDIEKEINGSIKEIDTIKKEQAVAQDLVDQFVSTNWDEERSDFEFDIKRDFKDLTALNEKGNKLENQDTKIQEFIQKLKVILSGEIACPKCSHKFLLDEDVDLDEQKDKYASALDLKIKVDQAKADNKIVVDNQKKGITDLEKQISAINKKQEAESEAKGLLIQAVTAIHRKAIAADRSNVQLERELSTLKEEVDGYDTQIEKCKYQIDNLKTEIANCKIEIDNFKFAIKGYHSEIANLTVGNNKDAIKVLQSDLIALEASLKTLRQSLIKVGDQIYEANQWMNNFKQFRTFLANQSLDIIEYHCNRYLAEMGSDLRVKMEGFKMLANGTIKDDITAKIIRDRERSFSSFSGGEQGRLLFASILANRHMINETHPYGGLDFLSIDEVFEGVDSIGLKHLIKSAKTLNIPVMIITHVTDEDTSGDVITIVKENGVSTIQKQRL
jgi:exonuclease SbcC